MGQDGDRVPVAEDLAPAHCRYCTYGHWRSRSGVWRGYWPSLLLVKRVVVICVFVCRLVVVFCFFFFLKKERNPAQSHKSKPVPPRGPARSQHNFCTERMARPRAPSGPSGAVTGQTAKYNHGLIYLLPSWKAWFRRSGGGGNQSGRCDGPSPQRDLANAGIANPLPSPCITSRSANVSYNRNGAILVKQVCIF